MFSCLSFPLVHERYLASQQWCGKASLHAVWATARDTKGLHELLQAIHRLVCTKRLNSFYSDGIIPCLIARQIHPRLEGFWPRQYPKSIAALCLESLHPRGYGLHI